LSSDAVWTVFRKQTLAKQLPITQRVGFEETPIAKHTRIEAMLFHLIRAIKDRTNDPNLPVLVDIDKRRPGYRRLLFFQTVALLLLVLVLLFFYLKGWEIILPLP
jgi:hypothetical protein